MTMQKGRLTSLLICLVLILQSAELLAGWREALPDARRLGSGEMRVFGLSIYSAQFWSQRLIAGDPLDSDAPFALELTYSRAVSRDDLVEASLKEIRRLSPNSLNTELMTRWEREMRQAFVDVRAGDRITGVYMPGEGARFYVGETLQHVVRDEAFAKAFFAIWLDPRTRNPELRAQLLGAAKP
ncbi:MULTISPECIES: chalcone isomerase family protein [Pseudomonas]|uniref:chalcone isomerase family protein n=1 Tax=Pseudomonas TaxID=286 RepID=UPI0004857EB8|nr:MULTISPECIES: chalcone isomerase family protein [Pseudomonas]QXN50325.1 chalcone isomerase family protein [Pseudomonas fluorescens]WSO24640.1 chalcone isomerase family protein [Pseudomonas fluorescens]